MFAPPQTVVETSPRWAYLRVQTYRCFLSCLAILLACLAAPAAALDTVYLVRHAEKAPWPSDRDLDAFQPLSPEGSTRAEALASRLKDAGISIVYTSRTTRTIATGAPLAQGANVPIVADDATAKPDDRTAFLDRLAG
jgi:hypothetical protein